MDKPELYVIPATPGYFMVGLSENSDLADGWEPWREPIVGWAVSTVYDGEFYTVCCPITPSEDGSGTAVWNVLSPFGTVSTSRGATYETYDRWAADYKKKERNLTHDASVR